MLPNIWGEGLSIVSPLPMKFVLIHFIYIKSSILYLLINIFSKEFYKTYGEGLCIVCPPPLMWASMNYDNIHEIISERYLLSGDIKNEIIQLYKSKLFNI